MLDLYCFPLFLLPPQVHALNILRALFRDTRLGENIMPYVADGIQAAILGFTSPIWAVSNLLLRCNSMRSSAFPWNFGNICDQILQLLECYTVEYFKVWWIIL